MDNSHMVLVHGATMLLSILILNVNRTVLSYKDNSLQAEAITATSSVAQQMIDLIKSKAFDQQTVNASVTDINDFTSPNALGPGGGETFSTFNDVDDYNNYSAIVSTPRLGGVSILVKVRYVDPVQPDITVGTRTRMKRTQVNTYSVYLPDTLKLYYYSSY